MSDLEKIKEHMVNALYGKPITGLLNKCRDPIGLEYRNYSLFEIDTDFIHKEVIGALKLVEKMLQSGNETDFTTKSETSSD
jgi:hypothetical protein